MKKSICFCNQKRLPWISPKYNDCLLTRWWHRCLLCHQRTNMSHFEHVFFSGILIVICRVWLITAETHLLDGFPNKGKRYAIHVLMSNYHHWQICMDILIKYKASSLFDLLISCNSVERQFIQIPKKCNLR